VSGSDDMSPWVRLDRVDAVLQRAPADTDGWLSPSERERIPRLRVDARRRQYLAGHWLLRELLAEIGGGGALDWALRERRSQAPAVDAGGAALHVSLSHSGDWVAAAVGSQPIGVDIEQRHVRDGMQRFDAMLRATDDAPGALDDDVLLQRWVIREAHIKQHGGSALPEALGAIVVRRGDAHDHDVLMASSAEVHLAVTAAGRPPRIQGMEAAAITHWCTSEAVATTR
jgi:4'-phosphopantetheinyl transferase